MNKPDFGLQRYSHRASCMDTDVLTEEDNDGNWYVADEADALLESKDARIQELEEGLRCSQSACKAVNAGFKAFRFELGDELATVLEACIAQNRTLLSEEKPL